jgi:four helix bundle protein
MLVEEIYTATRKFPKQETFGLTDQLQRAAVSVPSNIAKGQARSQSKDFKRFLRISLGSLAEIDTQIEVAKRLDYISRDDAAQLTALILELRKMLFSLIKNIPN